MGISEARILAVVGRSNVDSITLNDLETLFGLFTAIKDGQATIEEAFPVDAGITMPKAKTDETEPLPMGDETDMVEQIAEWMKQVDQKKIDKALKAAGIDVSTGEAWELADKDQLTTLGSLLKASVAK